MCTLYKNKTNQIMDSLTFGDCGCGRKNVLGPATKWQWSMPATQTGGEANVWDRLAFSHRNTWSNWHPTRNPCKWRTTCNSEATTTGLIPIRIVSLNYYGIRYKIWTILIQKSMMQSRHNFNHDQFLFNNRLWYKSAKNKTGWSPYVMVTIKQDPVQLNIYKKFETVEE